MLIEKINSASFANSILRLEVATTNGKGEWVESGTLEIPGALVASVIQQMSTAASDISSQLSDNQETTVGSSGRFNQSRTGHTGRSVLLGTRRFQSKRISPQ